MSKNVLIDLCKGFRDRSEALGYKGKKREDALMDYFLGAAMAFHAVDDKANYNHISAVASMIFSVRGYKELEHILAEHEKEQTSTAA